MKCPNCHSENLRVVDTRKYDTVIIRTRVCQDCDATVKTDEEVVGIIVHPPVMVSTAVNS